MMPRQFVRTMDDSGETSPPLKLKPDGQVTTTWKTLVAVVGFASMAGGAYWKLQDHDRRLTGIEAKQDALQTTANQILGALKK